MAEELLYGWREPTGALSRLRATGQVCRCRFAARGSAPARAGVRHSRSAQLEDVEEALGASVRFRSFWVARQWATERTVLYASPVNGRGVARIPR